MDLKTGIKITSKILSNAAYPSTVPQHIEEGLLGKLYPRELGEKISAIKKDFRDIQYHHEGSKLDRHSERNAPISTFHYILYGISGILLDETVENHNLLAAQDKELEAYIKTDSEKVSAEVKEALNISTSFLDRLIQSKAIAKEDIDQLKHDGNKTIFEIVSQDLRRGFNGDKPLLGLARRSKEFLEAVQGIL